MLFPKLFQPAKIRSAEFKNRIISAPCERNYGNLDGSVTQKYIDYVAERARGGAGLIIVESTYIDPVGKNHLTQLGIYDDSLIPSHRMLTEAAHRSGGKVACEIQHGGRQCSSVYTGFQPVAPSPVPCKVLASGDVPRELTIREIEELINKFGEAARRAKEAGYDMVEVHGAHGYLIGQFLSPFSNKRTDSYGGSPEKRMRFPLEVVRRVREAVGDDYPVSYRISAEEYVEGGLTVEDTSAFCKGLEDAGVDLIDVSAGIYESIVWLAQPAAFKQGCLVDLGRKIKQQVNIPVAIVGRINNPELAERILAGGDADFICMGRALHADPYFPAKAYEGRVREIRRCPACMRCSDELGTHLPISCSVNPAAGRERELSFRPAKEGKSVVVIGGGPGGMTAAWVAADRGHQVKLFELEPQLGGQLRYACVPGHKKELENVVLDLIYRVEKSSAEVILGAEVNVEKIKELQPDVVVVATGASPVIPMTPGLSSIPVCTAIDIFAGREKPAAGEKLLIIGGGLVGCETALYLEEKGHEIFIVEPGPGIARNMGLREGWYLRKSIEESSRITIYTGTTVEKIESKKVKLQSKGKYDEVEIDRVILAVGMKTNNQLYEKLIVDDELKSTQIVQIGDCVLPRKMKEAIHEGYITSMKI